MSKEKKSQQVSETALRLAQAFQKLMEESVVDFPQEFSEQIVRLSNQVSQIDVKQQQSINHFESIRQLLENTISTNNLLENASQMNLQLGIQHYDEHVIEPMLRSLFPVFDIIADYRRHHGVCDCNATTLIDSLWSQLQLFIANYDVEIFEHSTGDSYDHKTMNSIQWEFTSEEHLENLIAQSQKAGFKLGQTRILRMETVSLFKYQPSETNSVTFIEREEKC